MYSQNVCTMHNHTGCIYFIRGNLLFLRILFSNVTIFGLATVLHVVKMLCAQNLNSNNQRQQNKLTNLEEDFSELQSAKSAEIDHVLEAFSSLNTP